MRTQMVSGSAPALGCRRVRLAPDISKIPPACGRFFYKLNPRGAVLVHPRAGALSETVALLRTILLFDSIFFQPGCGNNVLN